MENITLDNISEIDIGLRIGTNLLRAGAEIKRVEQTITYILSSYGAVNVDVFCIPSLILLSVEFNGDRRTTRIERNKIINIDLYRIEKFNSLSRYIALEKPSLDVVYEEILKIESKKDYSFIILLFGALFSSFGFSLLFGGSFLDGLAAGIVGIIIYALNQIKLKEQYATVHTLFCSLVGGLLCVLMTYIKLANNLSAVMTGAIMILIPGLMISTSIRDIIIDDILSGSLRFLQSIFISLAIAAGFSIWTRIYGGDIALSMNDTLYIPIIGALVGTFGFSLLFNSKYKRLPIVIIGGLITFTLYIILLKIAGLNPFFSNLISAFTAGLLSEVLARLLKAPTTSFMLPSLIPLVPGASLFFTMYYLVNGDLGNFISTLMTTLLVILAIALGIVVSGVLFSLILKKNNNK